MQIGMASCDKKELPICENNHKKKIGHVVIKKKVTNKKIILEHSQPEHVESMINHLNMYGFALDRSIMGSGKTYCFMEIFLRLKFKHIIYVGTLTMIEDVKPLFREYGIPTTHLITFQKLRSMK